MQSTNTETATTATRSGPSVTRLNLCGCLNGLNADNEADEINDHEDNGARAPCPMWDGPMQPRSAAACSATHLVLDLDEVLIGFIEHPPKVNMPMSYWLVAKKSRPMLAEFLAACFRSFASVSLWTGGQSWWLEKWLNHFGVREEFLFKFSRTQCTNVLGKYKKALSRMWATDVAQTVGMTRYNTILVDDNANQVVSAERGNLLLAQPFSFADPDYQPISELYRQIVEKAILHWKKHSRRV